MKVRWLWVVHVIAMLLLVTTSSAMASDPDGTKTFTNSIQGLKEAIRFDWSLLCAFLMFFMMTGFVFLGGFLRSKNTLNYAGHCLLNSTIGALAFWCIGFALLLGGSDLAPGLAGGNALFGHSGFLLLGESYDVNTALLLLFQMSPCVLAMTIITGPVAERIKFASYALCVLIFCGITYPIYAHWIWGEGWLFKLHLGVGVRDFAGSGIVHAMGGITGLIGAWKLGPRIGKYNADKTANAIEGHNMFYVVIGTFVLWFGWLGYNVGGTLTGTDLRVSVIAINTFLAASAGGAAVIFYTCIVTKKIDVLMVCNGILAGLVAISASCAYVHPWAAVVIGIIGGILMYEVTGFVENVLKVDDPLGAVAVHGANGLWGLLTVGIFADGTYGDAHGKVYGLITGHGGQFIAQLIAAIAVIVWALVTACIMFLIVKAIMGLRSEEKDELTGLDMPTHGLVCYPDQE